MEEKCSYNNFLCYTYVVYSYYCNILMYAYQCSKWFLKSNIEFSFLVKIVLEPLGIGFEVEAAARFLAQLYANCVLINLYNENVQRNVQRIEIKFVAFLLKISEISKMKSVK